MLWDEPKIFFLERRYFFSIILSEFLKNRVALQFRMEWAAKMLSENKLTVGEIARSCGYPDPLTFSKAFKRTLGVTPTQYRREHEEQP